MTLQRKMIIIAVSLVTIQLWASTIQQFRYSNNFACLQMSEELESTLEKLGIDTDIVYGFYNDTTPQIIGVKFYRGQILFAYRNSTMIKGHAWLLIKFGPLKIPFESTLLMPINPQWLQKFEIVKDTKGLYDHGVFTGDDINALGMDFVNASNSNDHHIVLHNT